MTGRQLRDWLAAAAACVPGRWEGLLRRARGEGLWQVGVPSRPGLPELRLRRLDRRAPELVWDSRAGRAAPAARVVRRRRPAAAALSGEPALRALFAPLAALCPAAELVSEWTPAGRPLPGWSLVFERPAPWPLFARLDLAKPFEAAPELGYLMLDRRVAEVRFDEGGATAYAQA